LPDFRIGEKLQTIPFRKAPPQPKAGTCRAKSPVSVPQQGPIAGWPAVKDEGWCSERVEAEGALAA
jgi:hypothetical protein